MDLEQLRTAYQEVQARATAQANLETAAGIGRRSSVEQRRDAAAHVPAVVATLDGAACRRLAAAMQVVLNQDVPENLLAWHARLDVTWAQRVVERGSNDLLDKALELVVSCGKSLEESWDPAPEVVFTPTAQVIAPPSIESEASVSTPGT